jgi:hypothetical protein
VRLCVYINVYTNTAAEMSMAHTTRTHSEREHGLLLTERATYTTEHGQTTVDACVDDLIRDLGGRSVRPGICSSLKRTLWLTPWLPQPTLTMKGYGPLHKQAIGWTRRRSQTCGLASIKRWDLRSEREPPAPHGATGSIWGGRCSTWSHPVAHTVAHSVAPP